MTVSTNTIITDHIQAGSMAARVCPSCEDTLPIDARFCITCGRAIAATGKTERIAMTGATERLDHTIVQQPISAAGLMALCQRAYDSGVEQVIIAIHYNDVALVSGLRDFIACPDYRVTPLLLRSTWTFYDRQVGVYRSAEIWIKPWAVQGYACMQEAR